MKAITIKDIAKKCGVGVSTVSRAINNHPEISEETRKMIMEVIKENKFIPNNSARNLKLTDTKTIAVLIKGINNPFFQSMIRVFEEEIQNQKYTFILHRVDSNQDEIEVAVELIKEKRLKGIVFLGGFFSHQEEKLKQITVPFVLSTIAISQNVDKNLYSSVSVDDISESKKIVDLLIDYGHTKIAILASDSRDKSISKLRVEGYVKALKNKKISTNKKLIRYTKDNSNAYTMENGYKLMKELITSGEDFSAVFAISDSMAIGACKAILESGKKIPEDYSIVGFDGLDITYYYNPAITTIRQPVEEMAKETTKILFDLINKKTKNQHKVFEGELVIRQSVYKLNK
ncbi:LacI family DNA-binding transcriptional regulator [Romboutsia sp.]|uniref:LacI family DNA-binding transcriptional regulator n=1 Tax=Romboutsia sp. TaxID=1965302 RepID=UPI003F2C81A4